MQEGKNGIVVELVSIHGSDESWDKVCCIQAMLY